MAKGRGTPFIDIHWMRAHIDHLEARCPGFYWKLPCSFQITLAFGAKEKIKALFAKVLQEIPTMDEEIEPMLERVVPIEIGSWEAFVTRPPRLPKSMEITIVALTNFPDGPSTHETPFEFATNIKMGVKPTTTVGEVKDFVLKVFPVLEYNRLEIGFGVDFPDNFTLQDISDKFYFFVDAKILHLRITDRNPTSMKIYKYFINKGLSQTAAQAETARIMRSFKPKKKIYY